jgi:hypothetical protein
MGPPGPTGVPGPRGFPGMEYNNIQKTATYFSEYSRQYYLSQNDQNNVRVNPAHEKSCTGLKSI